MSNAPSCSILNVAFMSVPSYLTEPQMMMMSNTAKKKDNSTPSMICSSLVKRPSTTGTFRQTRGYTHNNSISLCLSFNKLNLKITCSFDVLRVIRVSRLASNVCSSELEPGEQQSVLFPHRCDTF